MPPNILPTNLAPRSAKPGRHLRRAPLAKQLHVGEARAPPLSFDLARPETWPPLLRERDICRDPKRGYPGILPMTRSAFRTAVEDGYIARPIKLGAKVVAWRREDILEIVRNGVVGRREQGRRARAREAQRRSRNSQSVKKPTALAGADRGIQGEQLEPLNSTVGSQHQ